MNDSPVAAYSFSDNLNKIEQGVDMFDLHCKGRNGEFFIIENLSDRWRMQRIRQEYFKDRALYYTSRLIQRQLPKGKVFNNLGACATEVIMASTNIT